MEVKHVAQLSGALHDGWTTGWSVLWLLIEHDTHARYCNVPPSVGDEIFRTSFGENGVTGVGVRLEKHRYLGGFRRCIIPYSIANGLHLPLVYPCRGQVTRSEAKADVGRHGEKKQQLQDRLLGKEGVLKISSTLGSQPLGPQHPK